MDTFTDSLDNALIGDRLLFSVMGPHAGESIDAIFTRKIEDIKTLGYTYWLHRSSKAKPDHVQQFCNGSPLFVLFLNPSATSGARPTTQTSVATHFSNNNDKWFRLPIGLSPVTGKLGKPSAFKFDALILASAQTYRTIDLWQYKEFAEDNRPIVFKLGASTLCAVRGNTPTNLKKMNSRHRRVIAVGRLSSPFSVWLKKEISEVDVK